MVSSEAKRTRGPNRHTPWVRRPEDGLSVLRLALDTHDPVQRRRVEAMFEGAYQVRRALQRSVRARARAYQAATHERAQDPAATRERLGLTRSALEHAAYGHLDRAPHLRRRVTKALAMHLADEVWAATERHLFRDARGQRHGTPRVGRWFDFHKLTGRARSHQRPRKWETFRLHGTLAGHRAAYTDGLGDFVQPRRLRPVSSDAWWNHDGPLAVVFSGLGDGTLVLPVRLPTAPCNQPILDHHLMDPSRWHKLDLVRTRDPQAPGGWRYEAHLMVLTAPYVSPSAARRRAAVAIAAADRVAGIDVNVSNLAIASHVAGAAVRLGHIERDRPQRQRARKRARAERRRQRALERSRRAQNRAQYQLSRRQAKRARRRAQAGRAPVAVVPMGPRVARGDGVPVQRYRADRLSRRYHRLRAEQVAAAAAAAQARRDHARRLAAEVVRTHGYRFVVEDARITSWARTWGKALAAFSPGLLVAAIDREARAVAQIARSGAGGVTRVSTRTAMSQHCPCGARVAKTLADRVHTCPACGLVGDRDAVAAMLAAFVIVPAGDPHGAQVDYTASAAAHAHIERALHSVSAPGWQGTLSESTDLSAREGSGLAWSTSTPDLVVVARRTVGTAAGPILNEPGTRQTTSDRTRWRTGSSPTSAPSWFVHLWDYP